MSRFVLSCEVNFIKKENAKFYGNDVVIFSTEKAISCPNLRIKTKAGTLETLLLIEIVL